MNYTKFCIFMVIFLIGDGQMNAMEFQRAVINLRHSRIDVDVLKSKLEERGEINSIEYNKDESRLTFNVPKNELTSSLDVTAICWAGYQASKSQKKLRMLPFHF